VKARENAADSAIRWEKVRELQRHYADFIPFLTDMMAELGFDTSDIQRDIAGFIAFGPQYLMVQAQRGQAKTTICAIYAVWCLIQNPHWRVLIISAGGTQAVEISTLIVRLILNVDILECLRPDRMAGDRESVEAFDIHHSLKGIDKSPSVACVGIDSNLQGKRADLLIADDIESSKNGATGTQRAKLLHLSKDFTSICSLGRILWLGTPQTQESIYNSLPGRGVVTRIWPGRYPTEEQQKNYGAALAPLLVARMNADPTLRSGGGYLGDQGKAIDPKLLPEHVLQKKERDQGAAYFQLQHMLSTAMMDALRFPLKTSLLVPMLPTTVFPLTVVRGLDASHLREFSVGEHGFHMTAAHEVSKETSALQSIWAYIDPAAGGANADETAYAIGGFLNGNIHLLAVGGLPGGYELPKLEELARRLCEFPLTGVKIEKNMGFGAFKAVFQPVLLKELSKKMRSCAIDEDLVTGNKERRIINTLAPIMGRGALIVSEACVAMDTADIARYSASLRLSYSLFYQLAKMSAVSGALVHDDRVDALEGLCRHYTAQLALDQAHVVKSMERARWEKIMANPLGLPQPPGGRKVSMLKRRR